VPVLGTDEANKQGGYNAKSQQVRKLELKVAIAGGHSQNGQQRAVEPSRQRRSNELDD
jgi:hypothetical protein